MSRPPGASMRGRWRRGGFPVRVFLCFGLFTSMLAASSFLLNLREEQRSLRAAMEAQASSLAALYAQMSADSLYLLDVQRGRELANAVGSAPHVVQAAVYLPDGTLFVNSQGHSLLVAGREIRAPRFEEGLVEPSLDYPSGGLVRATSPVLLPGGRRGIAEIELSLEPLRAALARAWWLNLAMGCGFLLVGVLASLALVSVVTRPLEKLADKVRGLADGDLEQRMEVRSSDVFGELAEAFNQMAESLRAGRDGSLQNQRLSEANRRLEGTLAELREMQGHLVHAERLSATGKLISGVAHELNNPLTTILGFAELLETARLPDKQRKEIAMIVAAAERARRIVQDLLAGVHRRSLEAKRLSLESIADAALEQLRLIWEAAGITARRDYAPSTPRVVGDPARLMQVLTNLLTNAIDAIQEGGGGERCIIEVRTRPVGEDWVSLQVANTGPPVPPAIAARIFDPFFTTKSAGKGTGLGLSLVRDIVAAHGGFVELREEEGFGALFELRLPAAPCDRNEVTAELGAAAIRSALRGPQDGTAPGSLRVLLADDEPGIRRLVASALGDQGHHVCTAADGREALALALEADYDLYIIDLKMPELDGIGLIRELLARNPKLRDRILIASGNILDPQARSFLERSGLPLLGKPFTPGELVQAVEDCAGGRRPQPLAAAAPLA